MIDKNGKLFGRVNVIDLLIVLILIAAVAALILRPRDTEDEAPAAAATQQVRVTFYADLAQDFVPDSLSPGDPIVDFVDEKSLGGLESFEFEPAYALAYDETRGEAVPVNVLGRVFVTFTSLAQGEMTPEGLMVDGVHYVIGGSYLMNVGPTRMACTIKSFELTGQG